ncbi:MAG: hypothetical protein A3H32_14340 [Betaproteobacteria bacterium RIFCSPLOWO2_02_FULL_63_19]|nr:MAG: hypothetical protein A3H32_14340 [Betaproteobacteria bacterium RIFCSPLOWO2_02_FULL_63_19]
MTKKKPIKRALDRYALNEIEAALELLEKSWVDFLYGVRLGNRCIRAEHRRGTRGRGLATVHRMLEVYRRQLIDGKRIAIFTALTFCVQENVPLPYWLGDAILDIEAKVNREPSNLHELFGLKALLPADGKRAKTTRQDLKWKHPLWHRVRELMVKSSKDAAIKQAREELKIPYSQRKCREMFDTADRLQSTFLDAWDGGKKHRIE